MVGHPTPYRVQREALLGMIMEGMGRSGGGVEFLRGGGRGLRRRLEWSELWGQLKLLVPLATRFCQLGLAGALLACFCSGVALKTSKKGDGAQASGKGTSLAPHGYFAGPVPGSHEIQYG